MSKKQKDNSPEATLKHGSGKAVEVPESGPRATGKAVHSTATRRDDAEAKKHTRPKHAVLEKDQQISGFDTVTVGSESFPKHSTASGDAAAKESQIKGNRPGISPMGKK